MSETAMKRPGPRPGPLSRPFWDAAADHRLLIQHCNSCDRHVFYPRQRCPYCWSDDLTWDEASGRATIVSFVGAYKPGHPAFVAEAPYVIALVDLAEGPRMLSNILDVTPDDELIGREVQVEFVDQDGTTLPKFRLVERAR